jgi:hypothetical protein
MACLKVDGLKRLTLTTSNNRERENVGGGPHPRWNGPRDNFKAQAPQ